MCVVESHKTPSSSSSPSKKSSVHGIVRTWHRHQPNVDASPPRARNVPLITRLGIAPCLPIVSRCMACLLLGMWRVCVCVCWLDIAILHARLTAVAAVLSMHQARKLCHGRFGENEAPGLTQGCSPIPSPSTLHCMQRTLRTYIAWLQCN